ncbi:MAG: alpha amylase N-terminal ig-like domain-containing protein [Halanaerobiales bacterium]
MKKMKKRMVLLFISLIFIPIFLTNTAFANEYQITFKFRPEIKGVKTVHLAGSFNNWEPDKTKMYDENGDGEYKITIGLKEGEYQYKFVINKGAYWFKDPYSAEYIDDGYGGENSIIKVGPDIKQSGKIGDGKIIKQALSHDPQLRKYLNKYDEDKVIITIKTWKNDVFKVVVNYTDEKGISNERMDLVAVDEDYDYWQKEIEVSGNKLKYRFAIFDKIKGIWFGKSGVSKSIPDWYQVSLSEQQLFTTPDWVKSAVFYQIFPDRFYNGCLANDPELIETYKSEKKRFENIMPEWGQGINSSNKEYLESGMFTDSTNKINRKAGLYVFYGGDFQGIEQKLDYLSNLGINAIYLNPIFKASANHRYNTAGYEFIDDSLAVKGDYNSSEKLFVEFIDACHQRGIKVIIDAVFNHTGYEHYAFQDIIENGEESKYWDWYFINDYPIVSLYQQRVHGLHPNYEAWSDIGSLPKLNVTNQEVVDYIYEITKKWMDPNQDGNPSDGVDGWRLDVANEVKETCPLFWKNWRKYVKDINPDAYITGEIWYNADEYLQGDEFDGVMNYLFREALLRFLVEGKDNNKRFVERLNKILGNYPYQAVYSLQNLIGSHDTIRFLMKANGSKSLLKTAVLIQFGLPGAPMIYYGDEVGMEGGSDPDNRRTMLWEERPNGIKPDKQLYQYYQKLISLKKKEKALNKGDLKISTLDDVVVIKRKYKDEQIVIIINGNESKKNIKYNLDSDVYKAVNLINNKVLHIFNQKLEVSLDVNNAKIIKLYTE